MWNGIKLVSKLWSSTQRGQSAASIPNSSLDAGWSCNCCHLLFIRTILLSGHLQLHVQNRTFDPFQAPPPPTHPQVCSWGHSSSSRRLPCLSTCLVAQSPWPSCSSNLPSSGLSSCIGTSQSVWDIYLQIFVGLTSYCLTLDINASFSEKSYQPFQIISPPPLFKLSSSLLDIFL